MAPAAQMLSRPNGALRRAISQARVVTMRPPVADQGCPTAKDREPDMTRSFIIDYGDVVLPAFVSEP